MRTQGTHVLHPCWGRWRVWACVSGVVRQVSVWLTRTLSSMCLRQASGALDPGKERTQHKCIKAPVYKSSQHDGGWRRSRRCYLRASGREWVCSHLEGARDCRVLLCLDRRLLPNNTSQPLARVLSLTLPDGVLLQRTVLAPKDGCLIRKHNKRSVSSVHCVSFQLARRLFCCNVRMALTPVLRGNALRG